MSKSKNEVKVISTERKRIQKFEQGLLNTGDRVDEVLADIIKTSTCDGKTIALGNLDKELTSAELYQELVELGVLSVSEREVTMIKYSYKANEIYEDHFVNNSDGVKIKASSLLLIDNLFLDKARANIKEKKGN